MFTYGGGVAATVVMASSSREPGEATTGGAGCFSFHSGMGSDKVLTVYNSNNERGKDVLQQKLRLW